MIDIPDDLEQRVREVEEKAGELLPGDYTVEVNLFTDDTGKDAHVVAVHNRDLGFKQEYRVHEGCDKVHMEWREKV